MQKFILCILVLSNVVFGQNTIPITSKGGVYHIPCKINGLKMNFVFDTGASDVTISLTEALFMLKNGYLDEKDLIGTEFYRIANGEIAEGTKVILRNIQVGNQYIYNVEASVVHSLDAPLLLGQSAMKRLGNFSFNYVNNTITFGNPITESKIKPNNVELVLVGYQKWMSKNLDTDLFKNGDKIFHAMSREDWIYANKNKIPAWCYYDNNEFYSSFGKIYNWYAVTDKRGLAPIGYHIPTLEEWNVLSKNLGGDNLAGELLRKPIETTSESLNFNGELGGLRNEDGIFKDINEYGHWWTTTLDNSNSNFAYCIYLNRTYKNVYKGAFNKGSGYYIRCLKD